MKRVPRSQRRCLGTRHSALGTLAFLLFACSQAVLPLPPPTPAPTQAVAALPLPATLQEARAALAAGKDHLYELGLLALADSSDPQTSRRAMALLALFYVDHRRPADALPLLARAADVYPEVAPWL